MTCRQVCFMKKSPVAVRVVAWVSSKKLIVGAQAGNRTPGSCVGGDYVTTTPLALLANSLFLNAITPLKRHNRHANLHLFLIITSKFTRLIWTETETM